VVGRNWSFAALRAMHALVKYWRIRGIGTEMHPETSSRVDEERMNDSVGSICKHYGLLFWTSKMYPKQP
jgi:hypothetical protein